VGAKNVAPVNRSIWGIDGAMPPIEGAAMVEYEFGGPPAPETNTAPQGDDDPHEKVRRLDVSYKQADTFFRTGVIQGYCEGACDPQ
jgi:hypothetical protein